MNSLCALIQVWLNASQRSRVGTGMNRSAMGGKVKGFERSNELDTALYKTYLCIHFIDAYRLSLEKLSWPTMRTGQLPIK